MTDHITDEDGRVIDVYTSGENYRVVIFDKDEPRTIELDGDAALRFARDLFIAGLAGLD
jgi:hypothetical protein